MSRIIGGGGGGLTEDEVNTLIGRGKADGTAGLDSVKNLLVPSNIIKMRDGSSGGSCNLYSGGERVFEAFRVKANDYRIRTNKDNVLVELLNASDRNGASANAVAGIHNPCKTILNEHRPVCTKEYHLVGKYLDGADNPDVWFPIKGVGVGASVSYANRVLTLKSGTGSTSASRCVIDQTKFPITSNFLEVTCEIDASVLGEGGNRRTVIGFMDAFSAFKDTTAVAFIYNQAGVWMCYSAGAWISLNSTPIGRGLQPGDIVTVRLDRQEGSANIDIARFYVNGQKQYESTTIPTENLYAGIGVFSESLTDVSREIGIKYFGVRYVP